MHRSNAARREDADRTVAVTESYYDSNDADRFYFNVWGGEDIHVGLYDRTDDIKEASARSVRRMAEAAEPIAAGDRILDLGAGYGGAARYLASKYGCEVVCLNLSKIQNETNRQLTRARGLQDKVAVHHGNFEDIPEPGASFDVVWSQDSILHSARKEQVLAEAFRVLKPGGRLVFTDPMQADDVPDGALEAVYARIHLDSMGSFAFYRRAAASIGFLERKIIDLSPNLRAHYARVADMLRSDMPRMIKLASKDYVDRMLVGLDHWVAAADAGHLRWGILVFRKP